jgi:hypothetical protein
MVEMIVRPPTHGLGRNKRMVAGLGPHFMTSEAILEAAAGKNDCVSELQAPQDGWIDSQSSKYNGQPLISNLWLHCLYSTRHARRTNQ